MCEWCVCMHECVNTNLYIITHTHTHVATHHSHTHVATHVATHHSHTHVATHHSHTHVATHHSHTHVATHHSHTHVATQCMNTNLYIIAHTHTTCTCPSTTSAGVGATPPPGQVIRIHPVKSTITIHLVTEKMPSPHVYNHHHTVQVARAQVEYLRQWLKGKHHQRKLQRVITMCASRVVVPVAIEGKHRWCKVQSARCKVQRSGPASEQVGAGCSNNCNLQLQPPPPPTRSQDKQVGP